MQQYKRLIPLMNRVLIKKFEPTTKTAGGIILQNGTEKNQVGVIIEAGAGYHDSKGTFIPTVVKLGDTVLLPDFGGQKVTINQQELYIFRDTDLLGVLSK